MHQQAPFGHPEASRDKKIITNSTKLFKFVSCEVKILLKVLICRIFDC